MAFVQLWVRPQELGDSAGKHSQADVVYLVLDGSRHSVLFYCKVGQGITHDRHESVDCYRIIESTPFHRFHLIVNNIRM